MSKKFQKTKALCFLAVMSAMFVALEYVAITPTENIKITLSGFPIILSAVYFGPLGGAAVGLVGSFISQLIKFGLGPTTVLWMAPAVLRGLSMGLLFIAFKRSFKYRYITIEIIISSLLVTIANTFVMFLDAKIYGYPFALAAGVALFRVISSVLTALVFSVVFIPCYKALKKII